MKILITGGAGFIGSHLADRLLDRGDEVLIIDNFATGRHDNITLRKGLTLIEDTIADACAVGRVFSEFGPELVVHAAASYKNPNDWTEDAATNVVGTANVVQAAENARVHRFIYFQTALCYGLHPLEQPITLSHPLRPEGSSYAVSKTAGEHYVRLSKLDYISFRLANAYGPRNVSGPPPTFYRQLTTGRPCFVADTRRDFIYIRDLVDVVVKAIDGRGETGVYHISSGSDCAIKDLFDATLKALHMDPKHEAEVRPRGEDDVYTILLDPSKTNRDFDWKATTPLETGIGAAVAWYEQFGLSETYTHLKAVGH